MTTVTEIIAKSKLSCETSFKNESPKSIFDDSHTRQARGKPAASPRQAEPAVSRSLLSTSEQRTFPCKTQHFASRLSTQIILQVAKMTTVTEIVLHHFQKWRQLQRSYLTTSKSDDSYRNRTWPLPKVTTVTEIVLDHFQKWRQLQRSYLTTSKSDDSYRNRTWPLPKATTVTEIVIDTFQKRRQLQRSYLTTSLSDDSYRDRTWPLPKVTTVTEIVLDHFQKWRQLQRSYFSVLQKWRQSQRSSPDRSFRARLPSKTNLQSQFLTTVTRGKPEASPRQARGRLNPPFRGAYFRRRSSALFLAKHSISRAGYLPKSYFKLQKWQQSQRSYFTTSKSDDSYRDRTWPLPKVTTVTEIVLERTSKKWRQLQRSYLTTSKSDDSYRDRTSAYSKSDDSHRDHRQIEAFVRDFLQKRISKVNFWRQSHEASPRQARGKPEASPRQARGRLNPPFRGAYFRRRSSALFLAKHSISRAGYLPKSYFKLQKWQQLQRSYLTTSKSDDSYRDRTWPLPKVTTVTEIVLDHFQKWRQLQRSYLTTSKSDDSYRNRTWPLPKVTTVTEIVLDHFQQWRQLERSYLTTSKSDDSYKDPSQNEAFVR